MGIPKNVSRPQKGYLITWKVKRTSRECACCFQQWCHIDDKHPFLASVFSVQNDLWTERVRVCQKSKPKASQESPRSWVSSSLQPTHKALRQQGLGRSPGGGNSNPPQYSCLENPHGQRSLTGQSPCGHKESDTAEQLSTHTVIVNWINQYVSLSIIYLSIWI